MPVARLVTVTSALDTPRPDASRMRPAIAAEVGPWARADRDTTPSAQTASAPVMPTPTNWYQDRPVPTSRTRGQVQMRFEQGDQRAHVERLDQVPVGVARARAPRARHER